MTSSPITELRFYELEPGRSADMQARYHGPLRALFTRHGIRVAGAWLTAYGPKAPLFVYLMHWPSLEARNQAWDGFYSDPEWARVRTETNRGTELVERYDLNFLKPVMALPEALPADGAELEMYIAQVRVGASAAARQWLQAEAPAALARAGGQLVGVYDYITGNDLPRVCLFLAWRDPKDREKALSTLMVKPLLRADRYSLVPA